MSIDNRTQQQAQQFTALVTKEKEFGTWLRGSKEGREVYADFVTFITEEGIPASSPFFRERQGVCFRKIRPALMAKKTRALHSFHFNYNFVAFALKTREWPADGRIAELAKEIATLRQQLVTENLGLVMAEVHRFWKSTVLATQDHRFDFADLLSCATQGLVSAVDKYVPPKDLAKNPDKVRIWRSVAITRARHQLIELVSETSIHLYPEDKRKLHFARKFRSAFPDGVDFDLLADKVNEAMGEKTTTGEDLQQLLGAVSDRTGSGHVDEETGSSAIDRAEAGEEWRPDFQVEKQEWDGLKARLPNAVLHLKPLEVKLLRMKGFDLTRLGAEAA